MILELKLKWLIWPQWHSCFSAIFQALGLFLAVFFVVFPLIPHAKADAGILRIDPASIQTQLASSAYVLEDPEGKLTLAQVQLPSNANRFQPKSPNIGLTSSVWWLRFTLESSATQATIWWFNSGNRTLQEVTFFSPDENGVLQAQSAGSNLPFTARPLRTTNFVFPLTLQPQKPTEIYLRVRATGFMGVNVIPQLWQPQAYQALVSQEKSQWQFYLGLSAALFLFNLILYMSIKDINYLLYAMTTLGIVWITSSALGGIGSAYEYFWPNAPAFEQAGWLLSIFVGSYFSFTFTYTLTKFRQSLPRIYIFMQICLFAFGLSIVPLISGVLLPVSGFMLDTNHMQQLARIGSFIFLAMYIAMFLSLSWLAWRGNRQARFIRASWLPSILMGFFSLFSFFGGYALDTSFTMWASAFQLLMMALALSDRYNQERESRGIAQAAVVDALQRSEQQLEEKVALRAQELQQEQSRTKDLLHNILPIDIATELSETGRAKSARHEAVTILFTDFIGFTQTVSTMPVNRMVSELNEMFAAFDDITDLCGVEKIKTIGDAYMAVAGLPKPCADHAQRCVRAALLMVDYLEKRNAKNPFKWTLRVGIHSGPVVSGVVGKRKFAFDVWGDTVVNAVKMESAGEDGRVNISADTYNLIQNEYQCQPRGTLNIDGKGPMEMYFVT
jgi:class 3 adenylate cyclase